MQQNDHLDPVFASDRNRDATRPESDEESSNIVGRPIDAHDRGVGFHEQAETVAEEREAFTRKEAVAEGGSFEGLGLPVADDTARPA